MDNKVTSVASSKSKFMWFYEKYMLVVGVLGQLLFYTQGIKIFMTKSANDISLMGFLFGLVSVTSWLFYGIFIKNRVLVVANAFAVGGALLVVVGVLIHKH
jgi:MtN3 and saliva related transmembrane protein